MGDEKPINFYNQAIEAMAQESISVFEISDFNTTGMGWEQGRRNTPFYIYMKGEGISGKSEDKSGSFGIGKNAPFVVSDLRTIFASSVFYDSSNTLRQVTQGKSALSSLIDD